jgi:beta-galactosidase GanA
VTKIAEEFGRDPNVIGWQIDNEFHSLSPARRPCVCPACVEKFRQMMRERFGTIDRLNAAWGTDLWSQTYQSFEQLPTPDPETWHHPSLLTAWQEFYSAAYLDFARHQAGILHRLATQPVGTDMMPFTGVHYGRMHEFLDVVEFNHYNTMDNLWHAAMWFDLCRTVKDRPFWNTETQTCWNGSVTANGYKEPGFCAANSWLPIAMGAEANLYWLWRQHWSGQELMHGAVVSSSGRPLHILSEVQQVSRGFAAASEFLQGTRPVKTGFAMHFSHLSAWIFEHQPIVPGFRYSTSLKERAYHPIIQAQLRPDVILPQEDLAGYKLIFSPFLLTLDEDGLRERIKTWVEAGGTWVVGPLSDIRTVHAAKFTHAPFGSLEDWAGVRCRYSVPGDPRDFSIRWHDGRASRGSLWYDGLELRGAEALAAYTEAPFEGMSAATRHKLGRGQLVVLGTMPVAADLGRLLVWLGREVGVQPVADASDNLIVVPREGQGCRGSVVVEVENRPGTLVAASPTTDLLTVARYEGQISVAPYGVLVLVG